LQLIEAEKQLATVQRVSTLGEVTASLAHEIKNPLSSIKGTAEILMEEFPEDHPKREFAEILHKEVGRLHVTLENILDYAGGKRTRNNANEILSTVLQHQKKLLEPMLYSNGIEFEFKNLQYGDMFYVVGDPLRQVFMNLMINSIEVLKDSKQPKIIVEIKQSAHGYSVEVHDNGPGITPENQQKLFSPFFTTKENGTGLGLLISRKLVEGCGGTLTLKESQLGGACFSVFFPSDNQLGAVNKVIEGGLW
jgi:signal transduction histidine kinase